MSSICRTKSLDHLVLTVSDLDATIKFYEEVMGMQVETFASAGLPNVKRYALKFGCQKINLHVHGKEFEPKAQVRKAVFRTGAVQQKLTRSQSVQPGSADLCFLIDDDVDDVLEALKGRQIEVLEGGQVVERTGAQGKIRSVYCRDPDGNLVEQVSPFLKFA